MSILDYCNSLCHGINEGLLNKLQQIQNTSARLVKDTRKYTTIISLRFFEICIGIGFQFVKQSFSNWRLWSIKFNVSTVRVYPALQRTERTESCIQSWSAAHAVGWQIGAACSKNTNCDIWSTGFRSGRPGVWNSLPPALRDLTLNSFSAVIFALIVRCIRKCS